MKMTRFAWLVPVALTLTACGGSDENIPVAQDESAAETATAAAEGAIAAPTTPATQEEIDAAFECRALIAGGMASRQVLAEDQVPDAIRALTEGQLAYWNSKVNAVTAGVMTQDERSERLWDTTKTMVTREQLEDAVTQMEPCLAEIG